MSLQNLQENIGSSILLQTARNLMKKAKVERKDFQFDLLDYRNTPVEEIGLSPAQMLMGR